MKALAFVVVLLLLIVFPVCLACAQASQPVDGRVALHPAETPAVAASSQPDGMQQPPAASDDGGPGSGPPAGMEGSRLISGLMAAGIMIALVIAGLLAMSVYKKK